MEEGGVDRSSRMLLQRRKPQIYQDGRRVADTTPTEKSVGTNDRPLTIGARPGPGSFSKIEVEWVKIYRRYLESV